MILNPAERGDEKVFWKYMSPSFLNSIDFAKDSITVSFSPEEEILNNDESVLAFCERLEKIVERHSFVNQLERHNYSFEEAKRIVEACDEEITESIDNLELFDRRIRFTVDVEIPLTEQDCQNDGIEFIDIIDDVTRIRFDVLDFEEEMADEDRKKAIVPFQLAYAVSIHKAQGLEYRSVKVVIPSSNAEKITHGIFYTAITRAKEKLKIYWSSETMQEVVAGFSVDTSRQKSLAIIKEKLKQDKNT